MYVKIAVGKSYAMPKSAYMVQPSNRKSEIIDKYKFESIYLYDDPNVVDQSQKDYYKHDYILFDKAQVL